MALIKCSECGQRISNKALTCPNCGSPTELASEKAKEELVGEIGCAVVSVLVLLGGIFVLYIGIWLPMNAPPPPRECRYLNIYGEHCF